MRHLPRVLGVCLLLWALAACGSTFRDSKVSDVPIDVSRASIKEVDIDVVLPDVRHEVDRVLPGAFFQGMVFSGTCDDLPALRGRIVLVFGQVSRGLFSDRVLIATATVDTDHSTVDIRFQDVSDLYPTTEPLPVVDDQTVKEVASIASQHIAALGIPECEVTLTQRTESWDVRCGALDDFDAQCHFTIVDGEIINDDAE